MNGEKSVKILVLCTGNSCRSQMAHGFLQSFDERLRVYSAGTEPAAEVNPRAVQVMKEEGIDISGNKPEDVDRYLNEMWDYVITVCDDAKENCPFFTGEVDNRLHLGFEDPTHVRGTEEHIMNEFRRTRDLIKKEFFKFYQQNLSGK